MATGAWLQAYPFWAIPLMIATYWLSWVVYARLFHPLARIPGPWLASVSRLWIILHTRYGDMEHKQRALHKKYGPLIRIAPDECACSDPQAIKLLYRTQRPLTKTDFYPVWGNKRFSKYPDLFSVTDERLHADRRRIVNNVYTLSNVLQLEEYIDTCSKLFSKRLGEFADQRSIVDLGAWLQWYAFDVIGELYFGKMFGFMVNSHDHESYIHSLDTLMPLLCVSGVAPSYLRPFILLSAIFSSGTRKALKAIDHIEKAARTCVAKRLEATSGVQVNSRRDLLHQLLQITETKGEKVDFGVHEVEYEAYVGLFAGSDTTAIAMRAVLYFLMKTPTAYRRLQEEIDKAVAKGELSSPVKYAEAIQLPFLCACIKEGMRLHPSVGLTMPRHAPQGGLQLNGHYVPEGYRVGMNAAVVQRDPEIFGGNPDAFEPSRWLTEEGKNMDKYMLNFGAGTRTCIGKNISMSEMHKLIPNIIREFDIELVDSGEEWKTENLWFNKQTGINITVRRRIPVRGSGE